MKLTFLIGFMLIIGQSLYSQHTKTVYTYNQIWANHQITIKDSEYYRRLDAINRIRFENELEYLKQAYNMMDISDWERALYFSKIIRFEALRCDKVFIQAISYLKTNKIGPAKRTYHYSKQYCDPEKNRIIEREFKEKKVSTRVNIFEEIIWTIFF